jgi:hypothetical protein
MSREVLVVGDGKPYHVALAEAERRVHNGRAIWQKTGRRIKVTKGKRARPKVHGLSCLVGGAVATALRSTDGETRDVARAFVSDQFQKREHRRQRIERVNGAYIDLIRDIERVERERKEIRTVAELAAQSFGAAPEGERP